MNRMVLPANVSPFSQFTHLAGTISAGTDAAFVALSEIDGRKYRGGRLIVNIGTCAAGGVLTVRVKGNPVSGGHGTGTVDVIKEVVSATDAANKFMIIEINDIHRYPYLLVEYQRTVANIQILNVLFEGWYHEPNTDIDANGKLQPYGSNIAVYKAFGDEERLTS